MNATYLICGAMLVIVAGMFKTADGKDGRKWRQRRIAHVFGKRNGENLDEVFSFPQTGPLPIYNEDSEDSQDYDSSYDTEPDYIPDSVIRRYILNKLIISNRSIPSNHLARLWLLNTLITSGSVFSCSCSDKSKPVNSLTLSSLFHHFCAFSSSHPKGAFLLSQK